MGIKIIKLPNEAVLLLHSRKINKGVYVQITFKVGSANTAYKPGLLHFGEHMRARRTKELTNEQFIEFKSRENLRLDACTSVREVSFELNCHKKDVKKGLVTLVDAMLYDSPTLEEFSSEQKIIIAESKRKDTNLDRKFFEKARKVIYCNKYYHIDNLGEEKDISNYTIKQVENHISKIIHQRNLVVCIVGNISRFFAVRYVKKFILSLLPKEEPKIKALDRTPVYSPKSRLFLSKNEFAANRVFVGILTNIPSDTDKKERIIINYIIKILNGSNGEIYKALRHKNSLTYTASTVAGDDGRIIFCEYRTQKENINKSLSLIAEVFKNLQMTAEKKKEIDDKDKNDKELMYPNNNKNLSRLYSGYFINFGKIEKPRKIERLRKKVTVEQINAAIKRMMADGRIFVIVEGDADKKDVMSIKKIEKMFFN